MKKLISTLSATLLLAVVMTGVANAQIYGDANVDAPGSVNGSVDDTSVDTSADVGGDADADMDGATSSNDSSMGNDITTGATVESGTAASVSLTQREAAQMSLDAESAELSASAVATNDDLSLYAASKLKRDANLRSVEASHDSVRISYRQDARFLGFIPAGITAHATVTSDGGVDVGYPWYRFLFAVDGNTAAEAQLESEVRQILAAQASAGAGFNATTEAQLVDRLYLALSSTAEANAQASADAMETEDTSAE